MKQRHRSGAMTGLAGMAGLLLTAGPAVASGLPSKSHTFVYSGPRVGMRWGPVKATIKVEQHRIVDVAVDVSGDAVRSHFIERRAVPMLKQETLQAQSVYIDVVSGATQTSQAYIQSLSVALQKAYRAKTLRAE
jgi:uncharacterized protein with FMN-binding domain